MTGKDEEPVEGKYMMRRKFYIPKKEIFRDYRRFDGHPSNYLFECDFEEVNENDEDKIRGD